MRKLAFILLLLGVFLLWKPAPVLCVYCAGGGPCFSNTDCSLGCRCQAPPFFQGVCVPNY